RGKFLQGELDTGETLIMHLGMTGRFTVETEAGQAAPGEFARANGCDPRHDHVVFALEGGARVTFNDPRRFGYMDLVSTGGLETCAHFARMGPEPLSNHFNAPALSAALKSKTAAPIKTALLDQRVVAGLGNIYVCEALHRAQISPRRKAATVAGARAERLVPAIKAVLEEAIAAGGSTLRDFAHADGSLGYFQHAFDVYDREGAPCPRKGCSGTVARYVQSGRSTFACGRCQR
ncbi:MAG: bifunctional DNA-formamidopyrimidine glycosylase/DNA-(apurinic or apyrimidinic site) lyase, partial [Maricaulaceae bacterium]